MRLGQSIPLVPGYFDLTFVLNPGAAFSLLATLPEWIRNPFFILISIAAAVLITVYHARHLRQNRLASVSLGLILGPIVGPAVAARAGFPALFLLAAGSATVGMACICLVPAADRPAGHSRVPRPGDLFSPAAVLPSLILLLLYIPYGTVVAFIPLVATARGIEHPGLVYTLFAGAMLLVRAKAGEISDRRSRAAVIVPAMIVTGLSSLVLGLTTGPVGVLAGGALLGVGFGAAQPALMALTTDRVAPEERGKAMGTFYTAWELGIASGAAGAGWLLNVTDFATLFLVGAAIPVGGACLELKAGQSARRHS